MRLEALSFSSASLVERRRALGYKQQKLILTPAYLSRKSIQWKSFEWLIEFRSVLAIY
jgi:hypothetical protein